MRTFSSSIDTICSFEVDPKMDLQTWNAVPFDWYSPVAPVFVMEKATNECVSVPTLSSDAGNGPENFVVSSTYVPTKSSFTYDSGTGPNTVEVESSVVRVEARRSQLSQAFTLCLFIVNWALTVGSVYITLLALVGAGKMDSAVLLLPVTLVLTIPVLRGLYVGSPPFGIFIGECRAFVSWVWDRPRFQMPLDSSCR